MYVKCKKLSKNTVNQLKFKHCSHKLFSYTHLYNSSHFISWLKIYWTLQYHLPACDTLTCNFDAVAYKTICTYIQLIENVLFRWIFKLSTFRNWKQKKRIQNGEENLCSSQYFLKSLTFIRRTHLILLNRHLTNAPNGCAVAI